MKKKDNAINYLLIALAAGTIVYHSKKAGALKGIGSSSKNTALILAREFIFKKNYDALITFTNDEICKGYLLADYQIENRIDMILDTTVVCIERAYNVKFSKVDIKTLRNEISNAIVK